MTYEIIRDDCIAAMRGMAENSVDSIVCDPPYELGFMGKSWDASGIAYNVEMWREALRVLKPGGHLLAFSGSRTYHRMTCAIEDAGFEVRDQIMWVYGSGFPKSLDVSKAIDKANGRGLEDWYELGRHIRACRLAKGLTVKAVNAHFGGTALCNHWEAQNQNNAIPPTPEHWVILKDWLGCDPAYDETVNRAGAEREKIGQDTKARSTSGNSALPTVGGETVYQTWDITAPATDAARQWEGWGTALKPAHEPIYVARKPFKGTVAANVLAHGCGALNIDGCRVDAWDGASTARKPSMVEDTAAGFGKGLAMGGNGSDLGRWPANLIHDGSDEVVALFPDAAMSKRVEEKPYVPNHKNAVFGAGLGGGAHAGFNDTTTSAARFFYCAKASKADRGPGNTHPTVKPQALMRYLVRLVTPPGGHVLDPFAGSGSTVVAALSEGMRATGIELLDDHADICEARADDLLYGDLL